MKFKILFALALAGIAVQSPAAVVSRAVAQRNLPSYVSRADYPASAVRAGEEGEVAFRLGIGPDGRVSACTIIRSSGSAALDGTTCRIMRSRARFTPARDAAGRAVADSMQSSLRWRLGGPRAAAPRAR
jgi:protein TonB